MGNEVDARDDRMKWFRAVWQPAGIVYLCFCLAGLAAGLWHSRIVPHLGFADNLPLPTLQTLAVSQVVFFLLVYPIILLRRQQGISSRQQKEGNCGWKNTHSALHTANFALLLELLGMFLVTVPLYVLASWLGDATGKDVLRAVLAVVAVCPLGVLAGRLLVRPAWCGAVMLALLVIVLGLPGAWYICVDFLNVTGGWAQGLSPLLLAWRAAAAREVTCLPQPLWSWLLWPILAAAGGACLWAFTSRKEESNHS